MLQLIAVLLALVFLCAYAVFSSIEFGMSVFRFWPSFVDGRQDLLKAYISPVWETTNVFLVGFAVCVFTFFPASVRFFGTDLMPVIFVGLVFAGLRVVSIMLLYYAEVKHRAVDFVFLVSSFCMPCVLSGFYGYALTGVVSVIPTGTVAASLWCLVCGAVITVSSTFVRYYAGTKNARLNNLMWSGALVFAASTALLYGFLAVQQPRLFHSISLNVFLGTMLGIVFILLFSGLAGGRPLRTFIGSAVAVVTVICITAALQMPYLVYPGATVYNSFTDPAVFRIMLYCLPFGLLVVVPPLVWMYRMFVFGKSGQTGNNA